MGLDDPYAARRAARHARMAARLTDPPPTRRVIDDEWLRGHTGPLRPAFIWLAILARARRGAARRRAESRWRRAMDAVARRGARA